MKRTTFVLLSVCLLFPSIAFAQEPSPDQKTDIIFKAKVLEIVAEEEKQIDDGGSVLQQNIKLQGLSDDFKGKEVLFEGIGNLDIIGKNIYKKGDEVLVVASFSDTGEQQFYITDYVRNKSLGFLFLIFSLALLLVGRWKGLRALISLTLSFAIIVYYIVPQIIGGADAVIVTLIGSIAILFSVIYLTEGFNKNSNVASLSIFISLVFTIFLSWFFVELARLSGVSSEEIAFLADLKDVTINFKGLLLSGIIIGTLGVLDDVVVSQVAAVDQLYKANELLSKKEVFRSAYKVGISHISSMANTLFLAYAGVSFPLLILFFSGQSAFSGFFDVINNEAIATEIVRTLAGSIGLIFAVPISTWLAVVFFKEKGRRKGLKFIF